MAVLVLDWIIMYSKMVQLVHIGGVQQPVMSMSIM